MEKLMLVFYICVVVCTMDISGEEETNHGVAFSAVLTKSTSRMLIYEKVKYNKLMTNFNNAYDNETGIFTAPSGGLYVFTWATAMKWGHWQETQLMCNEDVVAMTIADSYKHGDRSTATGTVVLDLSQNDTVYVRTGPRGDRAVRGDGDSTFSGWKLYTP